jgi:cytochrome P450
MTNAIQATQLLDASVIDDPYAFYAALRDSAPVWHVPETDVYVVSSFALLTEAASRVEDFSSNIRALLYKDESGLPARLSFGESGADALATADPPIHKLHRDAVFPELVAQRMGELKPDIAELARNCVIEALNEQTVDFMNVVGNVIPITVISRLIGFQNSDLDQLLEAAFDSTALLGAMISLEELGTLVARTGEIGSWISQQLHDAMEDPQHDILGTVARGIASDALTAPEGVLILHTLLSAGGESTTSLLGNAVRVLAEQQDLQGSLRENQEMIPRFIEELLRLESPFRLRMRSVSKNTELGGVEIPADATLLLFWGAANRDPRAFPNPDEIVLDRPVPRRHVGFGRGIHHCVGAPLARLEAQTVLSTLLEQTSEFFLDPESRPVWVQSLMVRRHEVLPLRVIRR